MPPRVRAEHEADNEASDRATAAQAEVVWIFVERGLLHNLSPKYEFPSYYIHVATTCHLVWGEFFEVVAETSSSSTDAELQVGLVSLGLEET